MRTHWLKGGGAMTWAAFTPNIRGRVNVLALIGATLYVDKEMPIEEARAIWREFRDQGWVLGDALCPPPIPTLRMWIYD